MDDGATAAAFSEFQVQGGMFPAVSLDHRQHISINLGQVPFQYKPQAYQGLCCCPEQKHQPSATTSVPSIPAATAKKKGEEDHLVAVTGTKAAASRPKKKSKPNRPSIVAEALDLTKYSSVEELEQLGLDRLKSALVAAGEKCGGTLKERAQRLFNRKEGEMK